MCFCESDIVNVKIHLRSKTRIPGIKYNHEALSKVAEAFGFQWSTEVDALGETEVQRLANALLAALPASERPESPLGRVA